MEDISNYEKIKADSKRFYDQIGKVACPAFGQEVFFTSEGFNHLVYKNDRRERDIPAWITNYHRDIKLISTMKGSPSDD